MVDFYNRYKQRIKFLYRWTYPVIFVVSSQAGSQLHSILKKLTDDCLTEPIHFDGCVDKLKSNQKIRNVIFEVLSLSVDDRNNMLKAISSFKNIKSIYLLGKPSETKEKQHEFLRRFEKVRIFCEEQDQLAVQWVLDMADECRIAANQFVATNDKSTAREHLQRSLNLYEHLSKFIDIARRKES